MYVQLRRRQLVFAIGILFCLSSSSAAQDSVTNGQPPGPVTFLESTREQDGLAGSVRRVKTENATLHLKEGKVGEGPRQLLEVTTYALNGNRTENVSYPVPGGPAGKEEYRYDDKGNIIEMTLKAADGSIISREAYEYEFDRFGNWRKMVTNLVVFEGGELKKEPVEVTYRTFTYYFDDAVASVIDSGSEPSMPKVPLGNSARSLGTDIAAARPFLTTSEPQVAVVDSDSTPPALPPAAAEENIDGMPRHGKRGFATDAEEEKLSDSNVAESSNYATAKTGAVVVPPVAGKKVEASADALTHFIAGEESFAAGDAKGAIKFFLESLKLEPKSAQVNLSLGNAYTKLKKPHEAIKAFKRAIELDPELAEAHYGLGLKYYELVRTRDAANAFKKAIDVEPSMAKAHYGLALSYQELGDNKGLMEQYRILQKLDPALAKGLQQSFPISSLPCRQGPFCN